MTEKKRKEVDWFCYLHYLVRWANEHKGSEWIGCSPACFDEWLSNEYEESKG